MMKQLLSCAAITGSLLFAAAPAMAATTGATMSPDRFIHSGQAVTAVQAATPDRVMHSGQPATSPDTWMI